MKKAILFLITITVFFTQILTANGFYADVPENHEYYNSIKTLYDLNLLPQYENNEFKPDEKLKLTDLYELILTFGKAQLSSNINLPFANTDNTALYAPFLQTAIELGVLKPLGITPTLNLNKSLAKHFILSTMFKILGIGASYIFDKNNFPFTDVKKDSAIAVIAMKSAELGIKETAKPKMFKMAKRITRAEAVDYLHKIYDYKNGEISMISVPTVTIQILPSNSQYSETQQQLLENEKFPILLDVWTNLKENYLYKEKLNDNDLVFGAIKGMADQAEDKYTVFQKPNESEDLMNSLNSQEYEGVGMTIDLLDNKATIISPFKDSPAEKAGLKPNDVILKVNDEDVSGLPIETVASKIKGPAGTTVKLKILRNETELDFSVIRDFVIFKTVQPKMLKTSLGNKVGYFSVITFGDATYNEFIEAAKGLTAENPVGLIIDLRSNPGGFMDTAVNIISLFTDEKKKAVELVYADGKKEPYTTDGNGLLKNYKTVILVNQGSASASEILAGALKDYGIAKLIGTKTFGKGSVQQLNQYTDGSLFKFTISKWLTPNGTDISHEGITPDIIVENTGSDDTQLSTALLEF